MAEKILVIITNYNKELYIEKSINSVLYQDTSFPFDIYVVDDASTDHSKTIIRTTFKNFIEKNPDFNHNYFIIENSENKGISECCNNAIEFARKNSYQYITFIDGDDNVDTTYIQQLFKAIKIFGVKISLCEYEENKEDRLWGETYLTSPDVYYPDHRINTNVRWGKMYDISLFDGIQYPVNKIHEDVGITYKVIYKEKIIAVINKKLYNYEKNNSSITANPKIWEMGHESLKDFYIEQSIFFKENGFINSYSLAINYYLIWLKTSILDPTTPKGIKQRLLEEFKDGIKKYIDVLKPNKHNNCLDMLSILYPLKYNKILLEDKYLLENNMDKNQVAYEFLKKKFTKKTNIFKKLFP